jgi:glycosyltransferase involved in cell wall biosynthesis
VAKKKILFINRMTPFSPGGARKVVWELGCEMARRDWEVHFFYASHLDTAPQIPNIFFHPVKSAEDYFKTTYAFILKGPPMFRRVLKEVNPDIVYDNANPTPFIPAYLFAKNKLVTRIHHIARREVFMLKSGLINPVATYLFEESIRLLDGARVIADSESTKERMKNLVKNPDRIHIIPPGIARLPKPPVPFENRIAGQVTCICRMVRSKGVDYLIKAWKLVEKKHPAAKLFIAGKGAQEEEFRKLARDFNLKRCEILGFISDEQKEHLLETSSISVLPTLIEGLPIGILEAMVHGLPIVSTNTWGVRDLIEHNLNGLQVPVKDHVALSKAIICLLENPHEGARMANENLRRIEDFYIDKVNDREIELLERMRQEFLQGGGN